MIKGIRELTGARINIAAAGDEEDRDPHFRLVRVSIHAFLSRLSVIVLPCLGRPRLIVLTHHFLRRMHTCR